MPAEAKPAAAEAKPAAAEAKPAALGAATLTDDSLVGFIKPVEWASAQTRNMCHRPALWKVTFHSRWPAGETVPVSL